MRAPSLYTYVDSKAAIYDAMFAERMPSWRRPPRASCPIPTTRSGR